jgi:signal peptidase I
VKCPQCDYEFPVNCSDEFEKKPPVYTVGATCPNCRYDFDFANEGLNPQGHSGDRVLVAKCFYDTGILKPKALDVVVFKPPHEPQVNYEPRNYIKRLIGLPGETIGIWYGDLYRRPSEKVLTDDDSGVPPLDRWKIEYAHSNQAAQLLTGPESRFELIRKSPAQVLAMRRIVYDNENQPKDRKHPKQLRWTPSGAGGWTTTDSKSFASSTTSASMEWLRYRNLLRFEPPITDANGQIVGREDQKPELITDFMGYNTKHTGSGLGFDRAGDPFARNWVGDLMLECELELEQASGAFVMEVSKGVDRFQARWALDSGECRLVRITDGREVELAKEPTAISKKGTYKLGFANVDQRLIVWVDGEVRFGDGVTYSAPSQRGPTQNDLQPASFGSEGAGLTVRKLKLWRDTYYTVDVNNRPDAALSGDETGEGNRIPHTGPGAYELLTEPGRWQVFRDLPCGTIRVQPDHYFCLGDNSQSSLDGRSFGLVPKRLLQGRALLVYWPFKLGIWPFNSPENRFGPIH